jgi:SAM-dependent methyltransferase
LTVSDDSSSAHAQDHFARLVTKWSHIGSPLRPLPDESAVVQRVADTLHAAAQVVVLGLTPEIIACHWPADIRLTAVDHSPAMIRALWPPEKGPVNAQVMLANWCVMPIPSGTIDLVAGDGCYVVLPHPDGFASLTQEICRVLRPGGRFAIRVFLRPDTAETLAHIAQALSSGAIGSVNALKLRLLAALHGTSGSGTRLDDVFQAWKSLPPLAQQRVGQPGWTAEELVGIESYGGLESRYFLPTLAEFRASLSPLLVEIECTYGSHELADRCPTLVFARGANPR